MVLKTLRYCDSLLERNLFVNWGVSVPDCFGYIILRHEKEICRSEVLNGMKDN